MRKRSPPKPPLPRGQAPQLRAKRGSPDAATQTTVPDEINLTFKELTRALYQEEHLPALLEQQQESDDRSVCLLMSAMLERNLEYLIITRISFGFSPNVKWRDHLFMRDGALSSFHSNIRFARLLDLITDETMRDLDIIRDIRNRFAHSALPLHFKIKAIRDKLSAMRYARYQGIAFEEHLYSRLGKERQEFIFSCFMILHEIRNMVDRIDELIDEMHASLKQYRLLN